LPLHASTPRELRIPLQPRDAATRAAGASTFLTTLRINRGMSWAAAVAFRDKVQADRAAAGLPLSRTSGFYVSKTVKDQGQTGARARAHAAFARRDVLACARAGPT